MDGMMAWHERYIFFFFFLDICLICFFFFTYLRILISSQRYLVTLRMGMSMSDWEDKRLRYHVKHKITVFLFVDEEIKSSLVEDTILCIRCM